jgi:hypothetical protein
MMDEEHQLVFVQSPYDVFWLYDDEVDASLKPEGIINVFFGSRQSHF